MEGIVQLRIDKLFDNYIPCIKDGCDEEHEEKPSKINNDNANETWINSRVKQKNS
jgi:hypothetical protein